MRYLLSLYLFISLLGTYHNAAAEDIELNADQRVEWHQKEQKMVAIGNAIATKKDLSVRGDTMTAFYQKSATTGKSQITNVHAIGNVQMSSPKAKAYGNTLDYDLTQDTMLLRGAPAKIKTDQETITATESITYYPSAQKAIALGNVEATNQKDQIFSDKMIAYFDKTATNSNNLQMKKVEIFGHVKIITSSATVWADRGIYYPKEGLIKLYENVTLDQDGNKLHGDYAETDVNTGISRLVAGKTSGKRVTGTFAEKPKAKKIEQPSQQEQTHNEHPTQ